MPYVFDFDHKHRKAAHGAEGPPRRQGRQPGRDDVGARAAGAARVHHHDRRLPGLHGRRLARGPRRRGGRARARLEKAMGKQLGDAGDPLLVSRALRRQVLHARDDGHGPQPRPQRPARSRAWPSRPSDERFAFDSYRRFIAMYGRIVLEHPRRGVRHPLRRGQGAGRHHLGRRGPGRAAALPGRRLPADRRAPHRPALPPGARPTSCAAPSRRCSQSWNGARAVAYRVRERIAHDLGTAVNVQAMVFGNRDDNSGTGVGFTRDPATGAKGAYGDFLVNAQGEDVVAGIRNTEPLSALEGAVPRRSTPSCWRSSPGSRRHYRDMCDTEFTIEQGKLWMLQTRVGKRTGAGRPADGGRHGAGERASSIIQGGGGARGSPRSTSTRCCTPSSPGPATRVLAKGLGASPGRRRGPRLLHRRRRRRRRPSGASR